jgi:two-component system, NtrC family, sensor kinase
MGPKEGTERLRVAIVGGQAPPAGWLSQMAGRDFQVTHVPDVDALFAAALDLAVVVAEPEEAIQILTRLAQGGGPPVAVLSGNNDGDEHPHARLLRALLEGKDQWERTFDAIVDPIVLIDRGGLVIRANRGFGRAVDLPLQDIIGQPYTELLGARADDDDPVKESLHDGVPRTHEVRYALLPGVRQVTTSPFTEGGAGGVVVILKDVSERKEQEERILLASRLADIGQLAAGVAHEINTPLASIALRAESLLKAAEDPRLVAVETFKNFPRYLKTIDEEIFRCKKIIGGLLDFSRVRPPEVRETDINNIAEKAADLVGHQMKLKQIGVTVSLDANLPRVQADDGQIRQALVTLLMNALDATPPGGHVEVLTHRGPGDAITLSVTDTGVGIPADALDKIFSPFFTTKPVGQGTGLGLAICHGIVTSHGGDIRVESELSKGTRVSMILPTRVPARP